MHDIELKTKEPIYVKQFKIPEAHMSEVKTQLTEWLKLGVVEPCRSKYNSPIFVVAKKDGGLRVVQDFRALNAETYVDKYSMHDVSECVAEIGRAGSTIFSTLDLTSGFWQMQLKPNVKKTTAFTIPGMGQYCWTVAPMGLLGSPASFQRLVEHVLDGIPNVIVYIDDLIIHTNTHKKHRETLGLVFDRLRANNLKVNLKKCEFGSTNVSYLGFRLTPEGIKPGLEKLKAVGSTPPPTSIREVRQFLGLCNFFRAHVKNFAFISHPLTILTRKDCKWKRGPLPAEALKAFRELQTMLCSEPVIDYPRKNRHYVLITDASFGDDKTPGGLGAILTQTDEKGEHRVIAYASRKLAKHEKNYTPFLLEMQAALWAMDHFHVYLKGNHFTLMTDHKPLETMGTIHTKTLNRLQEAMNTLYSFSIVYKKGSEMPADFLSRNAIDSIKWDNTSLQQEQRKDPILEAIINFLYNRQLPSTSVMQGLVKLHANDCFMENGLLWRRLKRQGDTAHLVLFVPESMKMEILKEAHGGQFTGHDGIFKTKERILNCYYWPGMDKDINDFLKRCPKCQLRTKVNVSHTELQPLPQCSQPNQRIHADLFGPLKTSGSGKKYILCITDAFTKYIELVAVPDKEAETVAHAMFNRWICRYGSPLQITTDGGKEFCAKLSEQLYQLMQIEHLKTSPYHPQCNSQAEVVNKTIAKYLSSFVDDTTLDWEIYLPPLMFAYNTSMHSTTKFTPYFLTFGQQPRAPHFPTPDLTRKFYGESSIDEMWIRLQQARQVAINNNDEVRDNYEQKYNKEILPIHYTVGQEVFLDEHNFLHKNKKLAPQFSGPHIIEKLIGKTNAQIKLKNGRSTIIHLNRIKPFLSQSDKLIEHQTNAAQQQQQIIIQPPAEFEEDEMDEDTPPQQNFSGHPRNILPTLPTQPVTQPMPAPAKRGRGRPPKSRPTQQEGHMAPPAQQPTSQEGGGNAAPPARVTRSQLQQMSEVEKAEYFVAISFIDALKQLTAHSKAVKKRVKNKKGKNGSSDVEWTKLQTKYFEKFGDLYGATVYPTPGYEPPIGAGHQSDSESDSDTDSQPHSEHSDAEHSDHDSGAQSEVDDNKSEPGAPSSKEPSESDSKSSSGDDDFKDAEEATQAKDQDGHDKAQERVPETTDKVVKGGAQITHGFVPSLSQGKLPIIPGPGPPTSGGTTMAHKSKVEVPTSTIPVHIPQKVPSGTRTSTQDSLPSSSVPTSSTSQAKDYAGIHAHQIPRQGTTHTTLQPMATSTTSQDEKVHQKPITTTGRETGAIAKSTLTTKGLTKPIQPPARTDNKRPSDIGLLARLVGLTPSGLTEQTKQDLVGEFIHDAARNALSPLAPQGTITRPASPQDKRDSFRPKTPEIDNTIKWAAYRNQQEAKKAIEERERIEEKGATAAPDTRPTRSNFTAKPILAPPKLSLERQIQKQIKEDKIKNKLDLLEKSLLDEENKQAQKKK